MTYVNRRTGRWEGKKIVMHLELRCFVEKALLDDQSPENAWSGSRKTCHTFPGSPYGATSGVRTAV